MSTARTPSEATLREYKQRLLRVLVHIQQDLDDPLALDGLAAIACFSPYHFHRIFRGMIGESVMEHLRRLRLERAASELRLGQRAVTEIAFRAGYESHEAFTRAFKASYGIAPIYFRAKRRLAPLPRIPSGVHYAEGGVPTHFKTRRSAMFPLPIEIKTVESFRVAFMRHNGPYSTVGSTWDRLLVRLGKEGWIAGDSQFIGICHDDPEITPQAKLPYDACVNVGARFAPWDEIGLQIIAGGRYAVTTHFGAYHRLGQTYAKLLGQWLPRSGYTVRAAPCFEVYLNSPENAKPSDLLTDVYLPVECSAAFTST